MRSKAKNSMSYKMNLSGAKHCIDIVGISEIYLLDERHFKSFEYIVYFSGMGDRVVCS